MYYRILIVLFISFSINSCSKSSNVEYTDEMPPTESATVQTIDSVDHSSTNVKDPVFEQKN